MPEQSACTIEFPGARPRPGAPARFERPGALAFAVYVLAGAAFMISLDGAGFSPLELIKGLPDLWRLLCEMFPPNFRRIDNVALALLETLQMALVGTTFGVFFSLFLAIFAAKGHSPGKVPYFLSRGLIALFRTVPDLVWALLFVVTVGLGPFAGTLAIMVDTMGFCGRFFAEAMEEVEPGPQEALSALGAGRMGIIFGAVIPGAMPSFINTALFNLEKATRSSVVLGLVGAGGIGIELKVSMDMFRFDEASTIMLSVFLLVLAVERLSALLRRRVL